MNDATIRRATAADAPTLTAFNCALAMESENIKLDPATVARGVAAVFTDPARGFYLVAEADGGVVAALMVTTEWSDWRDGEWWWVQSVYVAPSHRRRGLYRRLYQRLQQLAAKKNVCGFRLYVERDNAAAQQTYSALGMRETGYKVLQQPTGDGK